MQVLGIVDSSYHILKDLEAPSPSWFREKAKHEQKQKNVFDYKEKFSLTIPYIGVSLINSYPQVNLKFTFLIDIQRCVHFVKFLKANTFLSLLGIAFCLCKEYYP